jgi:hypothetical protein
MTDPLAPMAWGLRSQHSRPRHVCSAEAAFLELGHSHSTWAEGTLAGPTGAGEKNGLNPKMRHSEKAHCAGKGTASGKETKDTSGAVPKRIPPHGGREVEELRQHCGAIGRTRRTSALTLQMARPTGSGRDRGGITASELKGSDPAQRGQSA